jgi:hypothetical protein
MMAHLLGALVFFLINLASTTQAQCTFETSMCGWTESGKNAWTRGKATPSSGTGASRAHGGKWFMYLETSNGRTGDASYLLSPRLSSVHSMSFYYHMHGTSMGLLSIEASVRGHWRIVWSKQGQQQMSQSASWTHADVGLPSGTTRVRIKGTKGNSYTGDMSVDTISFMKSLSGKGSVIDNFKHFPSDCIAGCNGRIFHGKSVEQCAELCEQAGASLCPAFEYVKLEHQIHVGATVSTGHAGDCRLQTCSADGGCANNRMDVYRRLSTSAGAYILL